MAIMSTQREQRDKRRQNRLRELDGQLRSGSLVVRQMTPEERAEYEEELRVLRQAEFDWDRLDELERLQNLIRDRVLTVAKGYQTGAYIVGRAGTGKIVCVVSGGNINLDKLAEILAGADGGCSTGSPTRPAATTPGR